MIRVITVVITSLRVFSLESASRLRQRIFLIDILHLVGDVRMPTSGNFTFLTRPPTVRGCTAFTAAAQIAFVLNFGMVH